MGDSDDPVSEDEYWEPETIELQIDGILDLHTFNPKEIKDLIPDYIEACKEKGVFELRIIHGKGKGTLRRTVHSILKKRSDVLEFGLAGHGSGGWGATKVTLIQPKSEKK